MLPMSGVGEPMAGAPGDAGDGADGVPGWGAAAFGAAGAADPGFACSLAALEWPVVPVVVDGCWAIAVIAVIAVIAAIAASANRLRMTAAGRYGKMRAVRGGVLAVVIVLRSSARARD